MLIIDVTGLEDIRRDLSALQSQMPTILAKTLTFTAERVQAEIKEQIPHYIDRPTPTTLNSLRKTSATAQKPEAVVWFKDPDWTLSKNLTSQHWMVPQVEGGGRPTKRFEAALQRAGILPPGMQAFPGKGAKLDRYGNLPGSTITQILSVLRAHREVGYVANQTARSKARNRKPRDYFATSGKGSGSSPLAAGVWQRRPNGSVKPILIFGRASRYGRRFPFYEIGQASIDRHLNRIYNERIDSALLKLNR